MDEQERWCLRLANTVDYHATDRPVDRVGTHAALVAWGRDEGLLDGPAPEDPAALGRVHDLREAVYRCFSDVAGGRDPAPGDLAVLRDAAAEGLARAALVSRGGPVEPDWSTLPPSLDLVRWRTADDAVDLLRHGDLTRVRECQDEGGCGWLFTDHSRNRTRRWCSSAGCGNRARVRRYQRRHAQNSSRQVKRGS